MFGINNKLTLKIFSPVFFKPRGPDPIVNHCKFVRGVAWGWCLPGAEVPGWRRGWAGARLAQALGRAPTFSKINATYFA